MPYGAIMKKHAPRTIMTTLTEAARPGISPLPLAIAAIIMLVLTVLPGLATDAAGRPDHGTASLLFWSMSAGFVRGVGFIPRHPLPRWLLSTAACMAALGMAGLRIAGQSAAHPLY